MDQNQDTTPEQTSESTQTESQGVTKFQSAYDDNKNSGASAPVSHDIVPDHTDVDEDDSAEPEDADVTHQASVEDVDTTPGAEVSE